MGSTSTSPYHYGCAAYPFELPTPLLGACVNAGMRPYLGRIRPENRSARATFMHPYSVATAHHDPRR